MRFISVPLHERAVLLKNGVPIRALAPGRHFIWGRGYTDIRFDIGNVVFDAMPEVRAVLPASWWTELSLATHERAIVRVDGRPFAWLGPGVHRLFVIDPSVAVEVLSTEGPVPALTAELRRVLPPKEILEVKVQPHERGIVAIEGRIERVLDPGRYAFWSPTETPVEVTMVDVRRQEIAVVGQELMTRDKVTLRLTLTAEIRVVDPVVATSSVASVRDAVYLAVQLAARGLVGAMTLDELLEGRDIVASKLTSDVSEAITAYGVELFAVGIKDVVLPGEMKALMNRVIEAEKEAAANVILRREETAATRQLANTAKLMADNPVLMRMRELETLKEIAGQLKDVRLVVGADKLDGLMGYSRMLLAKDE
ncbi:MAG: slipin family protein [Polyangiaceae bacterium]|nr:slipin family protein [Polyangiaceae bacterium]